MKHYDAKYHFASFFNPKNGFYRRTGVLKDGKDTGADPFMASFPELLDIGIMGHCAHGKSGLCAKSGVQCYQSAAVRTEPNMSLEDYCSILEQCTGKVYQVAMGGRGDPDMHEDFEAILQRTRSAEIVPNFTTSGLGLTEEHAALCKEYCGAVAVSWYRSEYTLRAIQMLLQAGVKTNVHYVIGNNTIDEAIDKLEKGGFPEGINAVVFLLHKPVGSGLSDNVLRAEDPRVSRFFSLVDSGQFPYKVGFDSCSIPGLLRFTGTIDPRSIDTCEGARWSAYISPDMKLLPCSFDNDTMRWAVDLRQHTIQEAWDSPEFEAFRSHFRNSCPSCPQREYCMGGCPIVPEVVLCNRQERVFA